MITVKKLFLLGVFILLVSGCASVKVKVNKIDEAGKYNVAYLYEPELGEDPRNVFPKVAKKLEDMGFIVEGFNYDNPIEGGQVKGASLGSRF